ncbi:alpha/beta hydrolase [Paludisphaera sp.]|uniref:alpha/beta hydrolase n=1 Tax=Paludisphaera sp. TaxID=2017432 RepID=UPI00301D5861
MSSLEPIPTTAEPAAEPPPKRRRRARRWASVAMTLVAAWLAISFLVAYKLTARRHPPFPEPPPVVDWASFEGLRLRTTDGEEIGGWFAEGRDDAPSVLFLHGNGGGRSHCLNRARLVAEDLGAAVMLISLRAHGDSTGDFNDIGLSARRDVVAAVDFLEARRPGRPVVVVGVSLGSAAAAFAAGELGERVAGYVLESPFSDLKTAVRNRTRMHLPTPFEQAAYLGLRVAGLVLLPDIDAIAPERAVEEIPARVPVLILAGDADRHATPAEARAIHDRIRAHCRLETFPGAHHENLTEVDPARYRRTLIDFTSGATRGRLSLYKPLPATPQ